MIYLDTETCGLHGMAVLLQYAKDDGPVILWNIWQEPIQDTLDLIEEICNDDVCGFNLAFDWFHLIKIYTTFSLYPDKSVVPEDHIEELALLEERARFVDICLKPKRAFDVMLFARRGPYQSLMERDDIKIRKIPTAIAWHLAKELEQRIKFDNIYFARAADPFAPRWKVYDIKNPDGTMNQDFKDIKLRFRASGSLKNLYRHAFKVTEKIFTFSDIEVDRRHWPEEAGYAPFALALAPNYLKDKDWRNTWPEKLYYHTLHWYYNEDARKYASDDVIYTRKLHKEHFGNPEPGDNDSTLACTVAACRWRGYAINIPEVRRLRAEAFEKLQGTPRDHKAVKRYIKAVMDDNEKLALQSSTKRVVLEEIAEWMNDDGTERHPAALRAREVLDARMAEKEIEVYDKLLVAKRFHASFKVVGTLSNRMAGADGLNPQGIKHDKYVRMAFTLADNDIELLKAQRPEIPYDDLKNLVTHLCGGDFKSFEVTIALRVFNDERLTQKVKSGIKVHGLMGQLLFPGTSYAEVLASEGTKNDMYDKGKKGFFLKVYFGNEYTIHTKLGIPIDIATEADQTFNREYPDVKAFQDSVISDFGALVQPGGIGSRVEWRQPKDYAETILGQRRYFTLENRVIRILYDLAQDPPPNLKNSKIKVVRRDRVQTAGGAVQSALYAAAFALSARNIRAAGNNYVQSVGGETTKAVQCAVWTLQPTGIHRWIVQPLNIHDEIMTPVRPGYEDQVKAVAEAKVQEYRKHIPLLAIDWFNNIPNWANKKGVDAGASKTERLQPVTGHA